MVCTVANCLKGESYIIPKILQGNIEEFYFNKKKLDKFVNKLLNNFNLKVEYGGNKELDKILKLSKTNGKYSKVEFFGEGYRIKMEIFHTKFPINENYFTLVGGCVEVENKSKIRCPEELFDEVYSFLINHMKEFASKYEGTIRVPGITYPNLNKTRFFKLFP